MSFSHIIPDFVVSCIKPIVFLPKESDAALAFAVPMGFPRLPVAKAPKKPVPLVQSVPAPKFTWVFVRPMVVPFPLTPPV